MAIREKLYSYDAHLTSKMFVLYIFFIFLACIILLLSDKIREYFFTKANLTYLLYNSLVEKEAYLKNLLLLPCDDNSLIYYRENSTQYLNPLGLATTGVDTSETKDSNNEGTTQKNNHAQSELTPNNRNAIINLLKNATVFVLVKYKNNEFGSGSGFFISQQHIVTNHHVVENAAEIRIINKHIGLPILASVLNSTSSNIEERQPDFAVLKIDSAPQNLTPLNISENPSELSSVISVGFPGAVIQSDNDEIPNTVFSEGKVSVIQQVGNMEVIIHSANISPGSSGGPLVNRCGSVVGVNTGVKQSEQADLIKASQSVEMLKKYLAQNNVQFYSQENCTLN